jgi:small-conductance mechanosensitive channel
MIFRNIGEAIIQSFGEVINRLINFIPNLLAALLILVVGYFVAILLAKVVDKLLRAIGIQALAEKANLDKWLSKIGIKLDTSAFVGAIVKWVIYIITFIAAVDVLKLTAVSEFLNRAVNYIPSVIAAAAILLVGGLLANFAAELVKSAIKAAEMKYANLLSAITRYAIWIFTFLAALVQLGIAKELLTSLFTAVVYALALAAGLSFGLGGKDAAAEIIEKIKKNLEE